MVQSNPTEAKVTVLAPEDDPAPDEQQTHKGMKVAGSAGKPDWCKPFPPGFVVPRGKQPIFVRLRAEWTETPHLGERQCVMWGITVREEHMADKRAEDSGSRVMYERAKLSIRLIAAAEHATLMPVDNSKSVPDADPDIFWEQIGMKGRNLLVNLFVQTHSLDAEERRDFFENCVEVRAAT